MPRTKRYITPKYNLEEWQKLVNKINQKRNSFYGAVSGEENMQLGMQMKKLNPVFIPDHTEYKISRQEGQKIQRFVRSATKKGYRDKPEYYPVPPCVAKSKKRKQYYVALLKTEIALRGGYK